MRMNISFSLIPRLCLCLPTSFTFPLAHFVPAWHDFPLSLCRSLLLISRLNDFFACARMEMRLVANFLSFFLLLFSGSGGCQRPRPSTEKRRAAKEKPKRDRRETDEQRRRTPTETVKGVKGIADGIGRNRQRHRPLHVRPAGRIASDITSFASRPSVCPSRIGQRCGRASAVNRTRFERRRISSDALWGAPGRPPPWKGGEGLTRTPGREAPRCSRHHRRALEEK